MTYDDDSDRAEVGLARQQLLTQHRSATQINNGSEMKYDGHK
jgi:hypothetical protein